MTKNDNKNDMISDIRSYVDTKYYSNGPYYKTYTDPPAIQESVDDDKQNILEEIKEFLVELLHSEELSSEEMEKFILLKEMFEVEREEFELASKRLELIEKTLKKKVKCS